MRHLTRLSTRTTAVAAGALLLAGGLAGPATASAPAPEPTPQAASDGCPNDSPEYALRMAAPLLTPPFGPDVPNDPGWAIDSADTSTYNGCAALSWISVSTNGATASSPETIMLFSHGIFLGTASATHFGFEPKVERLDDATLRVTYRYPLDGDANAAPRGRAVSEFYYDEDSGSVVHTGEFPPQ
ncbi:LppP/LprE family lipoprotein [Kocuria rhizophila]|uniref:LppP/LprE family lipoprotein n=1 Tax=Kocuria rhizophila TaxID=72000 RepID=UPI001ABE26FB|nr:LppP/LprE family lipoprotein [Kocuria rhizophila]MBO4145897.1 LppP/LprE family lipoprotein [Kocuria rhizophila]MDN3226181.1 LppP/LprE family lipoprotein [Kocuria rhizophila]QTK32213.1 LppP/LprE family lipoprotein [Kocuria rhizophila]